MGDLCACGVELASIELLRVLVARARDQEEPDLEPLVRFPKKNITLDRGSRPERCTSLDFGLVTLHKKTLVSGQLHQHALAVGICPLSTRKSSLVRFMPSQYSTLWIMRLWIMC